jgi:hypothetical protein
MERQHSGYQDKPPEGERKLSGSKKKEIKEKQYPNMEEVKNAIEQLPKRSDRVKTVLNHSNRLFKQLEDMIKIAKVSDPSMFESLTASRDSKKVEINSAYKDSLPGKASFFACFSDNSRKKREESEKLLNTKAEYLEEFLNRKKEELQSNLNKKIEVFKLDQSISQEEDPHSEAIARAEILLRDLDKNDKSSITNYCEEYKEISDVVESKVKEILSSKDHKLKEDIKMFEQFQSEISKNSPLQKELSKLSQETNKFLEVLLEKDFSEGFANAYKEYDKKRKEIVEKVEKDQKQTIEDLNADIRYLATVGVKNPGDREEINKSLDRLSSERSNNTKDFKAVKSKYTDLFKKINNVEMYNKRERIQMLHILASGYSIEMLPHNQQDQNKRVLLELDPDKCKHHDIRTERLYFQYCEKIESLTKMRETLQEHIGKFEVWEHNITENINLQKEISEVRGNAEILLEKSYKEGISGNFTKDYNQCTKMFKEVENKAAQELDKIWKDFE